MNINEEGKYYASMVRKFRTEYKSKNLQGFCKEQKVSYTKMLHCLRNDSYRKPSATPVSSDEELGLHTLVVEPADSVTIIFQIEGFSEDAIMILKLFDTIFREDKLIKAGFSNSDDIRRERQIRRIAKYRNNSYFVGSPESGVRFARLKSHFANIRKHNLNPVLYLCDVFRRIKKTAKDKLVDLFAHRWQLATVISWA